MGLADQRASAPPRDGCVYARLGTRNRTPLPSKPLSTERGAAVGAWREDQTGLHPSGGGRGMPTEVSLPREHPVHYRFLEEHAFSLAAFGLGLGDSVVRAVNDFLGVCVLMLS